MTTGTGADGGAAPPRRTLGDFTADRRILILAAMAVAVGSGGALAAWGLVKLIALVSNLVWFGRLGTQPVSFAEVARSPWMVAAPVLGGLAIGLMARFGSEKIRGHGIPEAIEAILIGRSRMSPKVAVLKPVSSALSIGTGGPFGAEGPIIMTGGAIGSLFAQFFHLTAAERKTLLVAGATAGMTAIFGTPVAAVLLAVELLLFEWKPRSFIPVAVACVLAAAWRPFLFEAGPLFPLAAALPPSPRILGLAILVGAVAGLQSGLLTTLLYRAEDAFERLPVHWMWWPALGGLAVGLGGLIEPRALGVGYDVIGDLLNGHLLLGAAAAILLVKAAIWLAALASGTSGGVLAPLLILGGTLGSIEGAVLPGTPGFWALIGMAAMMGGTMRAPLTGALFAVELTGDMTALAPLLAATTAAYAVTVLLLKRSILTEKIARRGVHITREYAVDPFELTRVSAIMVRAVETLPAEMPVEEALAFFASEAPRHRAYPVLDAAGVPVGLVTLRDLMGWQRARGAVTGSLADLVSDAGLPLVHPDDTVGHLADLMVAGDHGRVPVVEPGSRRLVGLVARKDLLRIREASGHLERRRERFYRSGGHRGRVRRRPGPAPAEDQLSTTTLVPRATRP
ncbi:chloride channel protein [Methylobacterium oxalidis]|uniref:Chloride channel protein n=1 Tax=Methylobacterium oxalidis TaxID=944322 RepID=A0A512J756_9HYPH|nr:chloride channel protein [Methylobacterium oxalidis]GEP05750.1 chloride channel protein [Methylobacterium oxalidis]GJE32039.1 Voltage-gated ClC-type chloride channel ClcB [Methylobacterium oxalidis]GLS67949.1 chloride channel protein [Methylobacterium oxalidis]